ncbi:MAG TPA: outer membrane protein assembly factor BamD [Candidatus Angelobacter sp.]
MLRKLVVLFVLAMPFIVAGCHHSKVKNPIANVNSKQPDKELYDRAMTSMKKARYMEARTLLETMINAYPDSEYVARAKLSLGDAWYSEGGTAAWQQAEVQYKDFITFFPNMPEAAEAQLKVAYIHYRQMEKPDRDYTQAMRAAEEYRSLIEQFPDSKLLPEAKQRLRDVQEILADRQWRIAHFYYLRNNLAAAQARLTSLVDSYPLYSGVDEALYLLGNIFEKEASGMRLQKQLAETLKARMAAEYDKKAIETYSKIVTRYPAMDRADDARKRLTAMKAPVPNPTPEAVAQNKAEEDSRESSGRIHKMMGNFRKHPDVAKSAKVGEPPMGEEEVESAAAIVQHLNTELLEASGKATIESSKAGTGTAPANQPPPSSQDSQQPASGTTPDPPPRTNDIGVASDNGTQNTASSTQDSQQQSTNNQPDSSSKKKGKKGLRKLIPF